MDGFLKQSTAVTVKIGAFIDQTDGFTAETGLTISQADVRLSKNGGNMAQKNDATACTHDELGMYDCPLNATDTDTLGILKLNVHESGALPVWHTFMVMPANVYDSLFSTDKLQVDAVEVSGDSTAADNLEAMFDGRGYAGGTIKLGVNVTAINSNASSPGQLEDVLDGASPLDVNVSQLDSSATAAARAAWGFRALITGTAMTGTLTTTSFTTSLSETTNDHYNGRTLTFISGALAGQMTTITDYDGASKRVTVTAMTEAPAHLDQFVIA